MVFPASYDLRDLFALNLLLQIFDGLVTYQGMTLGFGEGNPILCASFAVLGIGPTLLLFKAEACGLLFLLRRSCPAPLGRTALDSLALGYALCSLAPWLGMLGAFAAARGQ